MIVFSAKSSNMYIIRKTSLPLLIRNLMDNPFIYSHNIISAVWFQYLWVIIKLFFIKHTFSIIDKSNEKPFYPHTLNYS